MPASKYWQDLLADYQAADPSSTKAALLLAMAVAEHETLNGRAWPGTNNFGAVQWRGLTAAEKAAFDAGALKPGSVIHGCPGGVLHVDTHPPNTPYPVWFVWFALRVDGIAYFLKMLDRLSGSARKDPNATPASLAEAMYVHGYFEGSHPGARPVGKRLPPLTDPEKANINDYCGAVSLCLSAISRHLPDPAPVAPSAAPVPAAVTPPAPPPVAPPVPAKAPSLAPIVLPAAPKGLDWKALLANAALLAALVVGYLLTHSCAPLN